MPAVTLSGRGESPLRPGRQPTADRMALVANAANDLLRRLDGAAQAPSPPTAASSSPASSCGPRSRGSRCCCWRCRSSSAPWTPWRGCAGPGSRCSTACARSACGPLPVPRGPGGRVPPGARRPPARATPPARRPCREAPLRRRPPGWGWCCRSGRACWGGSGHAPPRAARRRAAPATEAAAALGCLRSLLVVLWIVSPYALVLALPAAHAALVATSARRRWHVAALAAVALLPVLCWLAISTAGRLDSNPFSPLWYLSPRWPTARAGRVGPDPRLPDRRVRSGRWRRWRRSAPPRGRCRPPARPRAAAARRASGCRSTGRRRAGRKPTAGRISRLAARLAFVSVVVPVYNERESVRPLCEELLAVLRAPGPADRGPVRGRRLHRRHLRGARRPRGRRARGRGRAPAPQLRQGRGPDGRASARPAATPSSPSTATSRTTRPRSRGCSAELEAGADLVSGWKRDRQDPWSKRAASRVFNGVTSRMSGVGAARPELRLQGLPRRGGPRRWPSPATSTATSRCSPPTRASA